MADIDFPKSKIWWIFGTRCQVGGQWLSFVYPQAIESELEVKDESRLHRVCICIYSSTCSTYVLHKILHITLHMLYMHYISYVCVIIYNIYIYLLLYTHVYSGDQC